MSAVLKFAEERLPYDHEPTSVDMPFRDLAHELAQANNCTKLLGSGGYGRVYAIRSDVDRVFKVCTSYDLKVDGYHNYLRVPFSYSGSNPFLPRVDHFTKFKSSEDDVFVYGVVMELLYPLDRAPGYVLTKMKNDFLKTNHYSDYENDPAYALMLNIKSSYNRECWENFKNEDLASALKQIHAIQKQFGHCNDMSTSNFMLRETLNWDTLDATYQLVITDPLS